MCCLEKSVLVLWYTCQTRKFSKKCLTHSCPFTFISLLIINIKPMQLHLSNFSTLSLISFSLNHSLFCNRILFYAKIRLSSHTLVHITIIFHLENSTIFLSDLSISIYPIPLPVIFQWLVQRTWGRCPPVQVTLTAFSTLLNNLKSFCYWCFSNLPNLTLPLPSVWIAHFHIFL